MEVRVSPFPVCDFCSDPEPRYLEQCEDFTARYIDVEVGRSTGDWAACQDCHTLIQAHRFRHLEMRAVEALQRKYPAMPKKRLQRGVELIHRQFRQHKPVEDLNP